MTRCRPRGPSATTFAKTVRQPRVRIERISLDFGEQVAVGDRYKARMLAQLRLRQM
jgi:hypothetical protein